MACASGTIRLRLHSIGLALLAAAMVSGCALNAPPDTAAIARDNDCDALMTRTSDRVVQVETAE